MKKALCALMVGALLLGASAVSAATLTTSDGVLSIETPSDDWVQVNDPNYWFTISNGNDTITIDHLSNGENLPQVQVADQTYPAIYQAFVSTGNEVFVVKALSSTETDLQSLMEIIGTIKVLKYNTKTAIQTSSNQPQNSEFSLKPMNATYYVKGDSLNVRASYSTDSELLGSLSYGDAVSVTGMVTRNGVDYGWYRISYNGRDAYVSAEFVSETKPGSSSDKKDQEKGKPVPLADGFTCYDANGNIQGKLVPYSDGYYYSNDMQKYKDNGDGSYTGAGEVLYDYNPVTQKSGDTNNKYPLADGFTCYDANGNIQGKLVPYNDGYYYSNDMIAYVDQGDGSYYSSAVGEYLYDYNPVYQTPVDSFESDYDEANDTYYLESQGSGRPVIVSPGGGAYYDSDGVAYYNQGDGTFIDENGDVFNVAG